MNALIKLYAISQLLFVSICVKNNNRTAAERIIIVIKKPGYDSRGVKTIANESTDLAIGLKKENKKGKCIYSYSCGVIKMERAKNRTHAQQQLQRQRQRQQKAKANKNK